MSGSSMGVTLKVLEVWPAGTVTLAGTDNFVGLLEVSETMRSEGKGPDRGTTPALVSTPAFSQALAGRLRARVQFLLLVTEMLAVPLVQFCTWAVTVTA